MVPCHDEFGAVFDPNCVGYMKEIIEKTGADIVDVFVEVFDDLQGFTQYMGTKRLGCLTPNEKFNLLLTN